jgi:site-specific DNA-adenine methylase
MVYFRPIFHVLVNFTTSRPKLNIYTLERDLQDAHYRLSQATLENLPWQSLVERYDRSHTLFHLDPPYWDTHDYGVDFGWEHYQKMSDLTQSIKGTMIITQISTSFQLGSHQRSRLHLHRRRQQKHNKRH